MNIAVIGAGKLGISVTNALLGGGHDVILIDTNEALLQKVGSHIDVMTVVADAKKIETLKSIHISSYDFLIAVTGNDEANILITSFAKKLGCHKVIARVRSPEHMPQIDFIKSSMGIDYIVNPDLGITREIYKYLVEKYTLSNGIYSTGKISILEFDAVRYKQLIGHTIAEFPSILPNMLVVAISRYGKVLIPKGNDQIEHDDNLYVVGEKEAISKLNKKVHEKGMYTNLHKVMIMGGGKTGFYLAQMLADFGTAVKIVEADKDRCYYLSTQLNNVMVLHGDATDLSLLEEENLDQMDAVVTCTGFDEDNLLLALTAKKHNVEEVIAKVSRTSYADIIAQMGIDMTLNPLDIITSTIIRLVQGHKKVLASQIIQGQAELMEIVATSRMVMTGTPLRDLDIPSGLIIAAIHRGNEVIIPKGSTVIRENDKVMMFCLLNELSNTEKLLKETSKFGLFK